MATGRAAKSGTSELDLFSKEFTRYQSHKARQFGGVESRVLTNLCFYYGEHYVGYAPNQLVMGKRDANKLSLIFNYIKKLTRKKIGRLSAPEAVSRARPDKIDPKAFAQAEAVTRLVRALDEKLDQPMRIWEIYYWLCLGGMAVEYIPYYKDVTMEPIPQYSPEGELLWTDNLTGDVVPQSMMEQQVTVNGRMPESFTIKEELLLVGDVGSQIYGPLNIFTDASVRDLAALSGDQSVQIAEIKTFGWITDTFGSDATKDLSTRADLHIVKTKLTQTGQSLSGTNLKDLIPAISGAQGRDDPDMALVITRFSPPTDDFPRGRQSFFVPEQVVLDDGDNPYEDIPLVDYHYDVTAASFYTPDFITDLVPAQKFFNKRISQLGEQANASIYDLILLGPNLAREDIPADFPGFVEDGLTELGNPQVARLPGPSLPGWFLDSLKLVVEFLLEVGGSDIFQRRQLPGQMRGSLAIPMAQEILDSEDGPLFSHMGERLARAKQMRVNRVQQFYPPVRTLHYTGRNLKDEVLIFHTNDVLKAGTQFNITIERGSLVPELYALREARIRERLNSPLAGLYLDPRTGTLDFTRIATDLKFGDLDRESKVDKYRKLERERIAKLERGEQILPPMEFWDHGVMMDELEETMITSEFEASSNQLRDAFFTEWNAHRQFLQTKADRMQQALDKQMIQSAVAQATQQAAAKAAAIATEDAIMQVGEQREAAVTPPTLQDQVAQALAGAQQQRGRPMGPGGRTL